MNCMEDNEKYRELGPIEENDINFSSNRLQIINFFDNNLKKEESIIHKTNNLNNSNTNSIDPASLFGHFDRKIETIIQPSNTFNFIIKEKEENPYNNFKVKFSSILDNCAVKSKTYFSTTKSISKSNNFELSKALKSRNNSLTKSTHYKHNKTVSKFELKMSRTKQDDDKDKDFFMDIYKGIENKKNIFNDCIQKVISLQKLKNFSNNNISTVYSQNSLFKNKIESFKTRTPNKKHFIIPSFQRKDSFSDFTMNLNRESRNNFTKESSIPKNFINYYTTSNKNKYLGSRILKENRFKNILRSTFSL